MKKALAFFGVFVVAILPWGGATSARIVGAGVKHQTTQDQALQDKTRQERLTLAAQLLTVSNVSGIIDMYRDFYKEQADFAVCQCDLSPSKVKEYKAAWLRALKLEFDVGEFERQMTKHFAASFSVSELKRLIALRQTDFGKKVVAAETIIEKPKNSTLESELQRMSALVEGLKKDPRRQQILEKLVDLSGGADLQAHILVTIGVSIASGFQHAASNTMPVDPDLGSPAQIAAAGSMVKALVGPMMLPTYALLYKNLSNEELERYLIERQTVLSKKFMVVSIDVLQEILTDLSQRLGARFAKQLDRQNI